LRWILFLRTDLWVDSLLLHLRVWGVGRGVLFLLGLDILDACFWVRAGAACEGGGGAVSGGAAVLEDPEDGADKSDEEKDAMVLGQHSKTALTMGQARRHTP